MQSLEKACTKCRESPTAISSPTTCWCEESRAARAEGELVQLTERVRVLEARVNRERDVP